MRIMVFFRLANASFIELRQVTEEGPMSNEAGIVLAPFKV